MQPIKYSDKFVKQFPNLFTLVKDNLFFSWVFYVIDSKYKKSVDLTNWLKESMITVTDDENFTKALDKIPDKSNYDEQAYEVLKWVKNNLTYKRDSAVWDMNEYWSTPSETITTMIGDCEDGAILIYALCRKKGIPEDRLLLWCGDVAGGGHAVCLYRPNNYPLNYAFLDWCYWYDSSIISSRNLFTLVDKSIEEWYDHEDWKQRKPTNYLNTWFVFSETFSSSRVRRK